MVALILFFEKLELGFVLIEQLLLALSKVKNDCKLSLDTRVKR